MSIKLIGRTTDFRGNTLWEIVSNLKNFGVGRVVVRSMFERYEEKSYMKILKVEAVPTPTVNPPVEGFVWDNCPRRCKVTVERVFRGKKFDKPFVLEAATYKADYRLLSKKEEADYCKSSVREEKIIAPYMELPPLLREFVEKETGRKDVKMKVHHKGSIMTPARLAKEGEKPNIVISIGLGKPHPTGLSLYDGINI